MYLKFVIFFTILNIAFNTRKITLGLAIVVGQESVGMRGLNSLTYHCLPFLKDGKLCVVVICVFVMRACIF